MSRRFIAALAATLMVLSAIPALADSTGDAAYFVAGASGAPVKQLQIRLAQLGFFDDAVDGTYGQKTELAIVDFKDYLKQVKAYEAQNVSAAVQAMAAGSTSAPDATPKPTEAPDADVLASQATLDDATLAMIYDDGLDLYMGDITEVSTGADVVRVQRRLKVLNYLNDKADGAMGANSLAALRKFQRLNNLPVTGEVDARTREILYTTGAVASDKPVYNQLYQGMTGDEVRSLQERLWQLGFMYNSVDGSYGNSTKTAVSNLQTYLHALEVPSSGFAPLATDAFEPSGMADPELLEMLLDGTFTIYRSDVKVGAQSSEEVKRIQRRLYALEYLAGTNPADGDFGDATLQCVKEFQGRNDLPQTGVADEATQLKLFSEDAVKSLKPYLLKVSLDDQRVYVYAPDDNEEYTVLVKKFICSTGRNATPTPKGVFKYTAPSTSEWHYFADFGSWAHWPFYIQGDVMFHSVLFNDKDNPKSLQTGTLSKLGTKASHGCVRLKVEDAKWIYENCPRRTTVIIY